ncbi:MAG TPA: hypothetical protein VK866_04335, partial [Acidimicrobiales bacterium]|nr:hypothetical protein [Acidimicrobiales bacterium]
AGRSSQGFDPLSRDGSLVSDGPVPNKDESDEEAERIKHGSFTVPNAHTVTTPGVGFSATEGVVVGEGMREVAKEYDRPVWRFFSKLFTPNIDAAEAAFRGDAPVGGAAPKVEQVDPDGVKAFEMLKSGATKTTYNDGTVRIVRTDNIVVTHNPDGTTTVENLATGETTTAESPKPAGGDAGQPDEEHRYDLAPEKRAIIDGIAGRLAPKLGGDGHTDPVETDDPPVGGGSGDPTATQDTLRGDDGRADDVVETGGGNAGPDFDGTAGAIDYGPDADGVDIPARELDPFDQARPNVGGDVQLIAPTPLIDPTLLEPTRERLLADAAFHQIYRTPRVDDTRLDAPVDGQASDDEIPTDEIPTDDPTATADPDPVLPEDPSSEPDHDGDELDEA